MSREVEPAWDILGIGNSAVDELIYLDQFPQPESKLRVASASRQGGGLVATALVTAARQGARTAFCSKIGYDDLSSFTLQDLAQEGVDCSPCFRSADGIPYHAWILVDQQQHTRTILYETGKVEPPVEHITPDLVSGCRVLLVDHHAPAASARAIALAHEQGIPVVSDLESDQVPYFKTLLDSSDHLILSYNFAARITGQQAVEGIVRSLASPDRPACVVTAGERGCWYSIYGGGVLHYPAYSVQVVDTTGCGDVFHGAYTAALARGESVPQAIAVSTASAALKATRPGGRAGIPDLASAQQFIREQHDRGPVAKA